MRQDISFQNMTRLGWDQSFLEDFSSSGSCMHSDDEILFRTSYGDRNVHYENIYNDLRDVNGPPGVQAGISYVNSSAIINTDRLRFLLSQVERRKKAKLTDNSYLSSSHLSPLISKSFNTSSSSSSLPPSPTFQKSAKVPRKDSYRKNDIRNSPREDSLARNDLNPIAGDTRTTDGFLLHLLVERYGLARLLRDHAPRDSIFRARAACEVERQSPVTLLHSELETIRTNLIHLLESRFYFGKLTAEDSRRLLAHSEVGTFFIRDSSNPGHLLSLSVLTRRGATSIRIHFRQGRFCLETDGDYPSTPRFDSVVSLVQHYVENPYKNVLVESSGRCDTPVVLKRPLLLSVPRLSHLARLTINGHLKGQKVDRLCLIPSLKQFLKQYPFSV